jgi:hypothetical protein
MFILQVQIVALRSMPSNLTTSSLYFIIGHESVANSTVERKAGTDGRFIWNQHFVFPIVWDPLLKQATPLTIVLKNKDHTLGDGSTPLPESANSLLDIWIPIVLNVNNNDNQSTTCPELHICLEIEPLGDRNLNDVLATNAYVAGRRKSSGGFGGILRLSKRGPSLSTTNTNTTLTTTTTTNSKLPSFGGSFHNNSSSGNGSSSNFAGKVSAVTLNELVDALNRLKCCIYLVGPDVELLPKSGTPERRAMLREAQKELDAIEVQINQVPNLGEWAERLIALTRDYAMDCTDALSEETWKDVNKRVQSVRLPPPLPSKEMRERVRSERKIASTTTTTITSNEPSSLTSSLSSVTTNNSTTTNNSSKLTTTTHTITSSPPTTTSSSPPTKLSPSITTTTTTTTNTKLKDLPGGVVDHTTQLENSFINSIFNTTPGPDVEMIPHVIDSLESFDLLMDVGFAIEPRPATVSLTYPKKSDTIVIQYIGYIWDPTQAMAISFTRSHDGSSHVVDLTWTLGERPRAPGVARGLDYALIHSGIQRDSKVTITLAEDMGFDNSQQHDEIPPGSLLILKVTILDVISSSSSPSQLYRTPILSNSDSPQSLQQNNSGKSNNNSNNSGLDSPRSRHRKFPARVPTLVLRGPLTSEEGDEEDRRMMAELRKAAEE